MKRLAATIGLALVMSALCWSGAGCSTRNVDLDDADTRQMVALLMPQQIRIVEAFTGFKSFDEDDVPDGIELLLQPVDSFGDSVKIAGVVRVELYAFLQASGNEKGDRVCAPWDVPLLTEDDQERYWNKITGMYEVELELPAGIRPTGSKYVLEVTYNTPLTTHMFDECVLELPAAAR